MTKFSQMGLGARAALLVGGAAVVGVAGYGGWSFSQKKPIPAPAEIAATADAAAPTPAVPAASDPAAGAAVPTPVEPAAAEAADPAPVPADTAAPAEVPAPAVPSFDVVRVEPDGTAVVAGSAEPGAQIVLRVDGEEVTATKADNNGNFATLFVLKDSAAPRMLTMTSILPDGSEIPTETEVAIAPTAAPVAVATAVPDEAPSATTDDASVTDAAPAATAATVPDAPVPDAVETAAVEPEVAAPATTAPADVPNTPTALLVTKDGVNVLQAPEPAAPDAVADQSADVSIDTISYTPTGEVQLAGRAAQGAFLRVYLDNAPLIDIQTGKNGLWASTLPPIKPGIYTLRVDQLAADGSVTARFETPFKRETAEALAAATQGATPAVDPVAEPATAAPDQAAAPVVADPAPAVVAEANPVAEPAPAITDTAPDAVATADTAPATTPVPAVSADATTDPVPKPATPVSVTVQPGFTLWGIATKQFGDGLLYVQVYEANKTKIRNPDLIYPGQVFIIPTAQE